MKLSILKYKENLIVCATILFLSIPHCYGQVTIGSTNKPEDFSILKLDSKEGGLRLNKLTTDKRMELDTKVNTAKSAARGLVVYNTDSTTIQYWDETTWLHKLAVNSAFVPDGYLESRGQGKLPKWEVIKLPNIKDSEYYLHYSDVKSDSQGEILPFIEIEEYDRHAIDEPLTDKWQVIEGLDVNVDIPDVINPPQGVDENRVTIQFQTSVQLGTGSLEKDHKLKPPASQGPTPVDYHEVRITSVSYAVGIFVGTDQDGYKLKLVRVNRLDSSTNDLGTRIVTVIGTLHDLESKPQTIRVAIKRRSQRNMTGTGEWALTDDQKSLAIGTPHPLSTKTNPFMMQSYLKINVYVLNTD